MPLRIQDMLIILALLLACAAALNLPGVAPNSWDESSTVTLKANKVTSMKTPIQYDYYDLPFCRKQKTKAKAENLGERLSGDSLTSSPYEVSEPFRSSVFLSTNSVFLYIKS